MRKSSTMSLKDGTAKRLSSTDGRTDWATVVGSIILWAINLVCALLYCACALYAWAEAVFRLVVIFVAVLAWRLWRLL
jgi:hypothetical protein